MEFAHTMPATFNSQSSAGDWAGFEVSNPWRVREMLRDACSTQAPITIATQAGLDVTGSLWSLDDVGGQLFFKLESDQPVLPADLAQAPVWAVYYQQEAKIQFELRHPSCSQTAQGRTLRADLPSVLYRMARRHASRVKRSDQQCGFISGRLDGTAGEESYRFAMSDVSIGGCGLWVPAGSSRLPMGGRLNDVQVQLTGEHPFVVDLDIRHSERPARAALRRRVGCAWVSLLESSQQVLLRWKRSGEMSRNLVTISLKF